MFYLCSRTWPARSPILRGSHIRAHACSVITYPATVRLAAGWAKRHARFESPEALAEQPAVARTAVAWSCAWMLRQGVACRGAPLICQYNHIIDGVARASSASTPRAVKSGSSTSSLVLHAICWRPLGARRRERKPHGWRISQGVDDEANSQIAEDGGATGSRLRGGTSVRTPSAICATSRASQRGPADPRETGFCDRRRF